MEQVISQLAVNILFDDYSVFYEMRRKEAEIIINIVYYLDKDWFRIFTLEREFTKLYCLNVKRLSSIVL